MSDSTRPSYNFRKTFISYVAIYFVSRLIVSFAAVDLVLHYVVGVSKFDTSPPAPTFLDKITHLLYLVPLILSTVMFASYSGLIAWIFPQLDLTTRIVQTYVLTMGSVAFWWYMVLSLCDLLPVDMSETKISLEDALAIATGTSFLLAFRVVLGAGLLTHAMELTPRWSGEPSQGEGHDVSKAHGDEMDEKVGSDTGVISRADFSANAGRLV